MAITLDSVLTNVPELGLAFLGHIFLLVWPGTCLNRSEMAAGFKGTDFQPEPSILDPSRTIVDVLGPT